MAREMRKIRSTSLSVDCLMMSDEDLKRYKGHHGMYKYHFVAGRASIADVPAGEDVGVTKEWLRPSSIRPDDIPRWEEQPAIKILLVRTHNEFSANPTRNPEYRTVPGSTPFTPLKEHEAQGQMIKDIFHHASLPLAALGSYIKAHLTFMSVPSYRVIGDDVDGGHVTSYYCSGTSWSIAWSYFHATRHTSAVMFFREGDGDERKVELLAEIARHQEYLGHPLLLAYLKTKISLQWTFHLLDQMNGQTLDIEKSVGLATWDWVLDRKIEAYRNAQEGEEDAEETMAKNQKQAVETYNVLSGKLNNIRFRLRSFLSQLAWLERSNKAYMQTLGPDETSRQFESSTLEDMLYRMEDLTKVHLHDADTLFDRLIQQMKSLSQLVSQRDTRITMAIADFNNELAWQGKNANRAMVAIAVVSTIFLPATFVASLFQAPMFNWQPKNDEVVVVAPFWIYWVVCGCLTSALALGWFWYIKCRHAADDEKRRAANRDFRKKILRAPTGPKLRTVDDKTTKQHRPLGSWFTPWRHNPKIEDEEMALRVLETSSKP